MKWVMVEWCMDCCSIVQEYFDIQECQCGEKE